MYWGLPVVTEDVRHSPEIVNVIHGVNGYIVERYSSQALAEKIKFLISSPTIYRSFSHASRQVICEEASIDKMCDGFISAIKAVPRRRGVIEKS
jgi:glycosyltransferase involved in cell wall biosynthesis